MVFSSSLFLLFFLPLFLFVYYLTEKKYKNGVALIASILFYSWGAPKFVFIILGSTFLDFYLVKILHLTTKERQKKLLLGLSISINLGLLLYFKYVNFFVDNVNYLLQGAGFSNISWTAVALPIGISFYTFQTLTYSIDVYNERHKPLESVFDYLLYIMLFPQMIAGPIVRFTTIADQLTNRKETVDERLIGFYRFCIGLAKKVLIANVLGEQADFIMNGNIAQLSTVSAWVGILAYTFQLYFDFSGYSDMAIGLGKMIGFRFPENFNSPYTARSISEFWRRWHITLGTFMRDYLYIPLGGSRVITNNRLYFNLWIVFLLSGLWHGASWNFVLWGAYHGLFLILDRLFLEKLLNKTGRFFSTIITFIIVVLGWVIFRLEEPVKFIPYYKQLFAFDFTVQDVLNPSFLEILILAIIFSFITSFKKGERISNFFFNKERYSVKQNIAFTLLSITLFILSLSSITSNGFNPFIYFRF